MSEHHEQLVPVYTTNSPAMIAVVKSLLDDAEIPYSLSGDVLQSVWPQFQWAEFKVKPEDAQAAKELLNQARPEEDK